MAFSPERVGRIKMFTQQQKHEIAEKVQKALRETGNPELPEGEIQFILHVDGADFWSWANIRNNGSAGIPIPDTIDLIQNLSAK